MFFGDDSGFDDAETVFLEEVETSRVSIGLDQHLVLELPDPAAKGLSITGAAFDPTLLTLVSYSREADGGPVVRYVFKGAGIGETDVVVKAAKQGGEPQTYRSIGVMITND